MNCSEFRTLGKRRTDRAAQSVRQNGHTAYFILYPAAQLFSCCILCACLGPWVFINLYDCPAPGLQNEKMGTHNSRDICIAKTCLSNPFVREETASVAPRPAADDGLPLEPHGVNVLGDMLTAGTTSPILFRFG